MKTEEIRGLFAQFESAAIEIDGITCWSARELMALLGYSKWENFLKVIEKAKLSCQAAENNTEDHFPEVGKMVEIGSSTNREIVDILLTRYACYLIAQNGDSKKQEIAFAHNYFAVQTRRAEIVEQRLLDYERLKARDKLSITEKNLSGIIYERGVDKYGFGIIRSKGDQALFSMNTSALKKKFGAPENRPLADFLPTISIKAKDLAAEMTGINVQTKNLMGQESIEYEHVDNSKAVRKMLLERGIKPEQLPPSEDLKKVKKKLDLDEKLLIKGQAKGSKSKKK